MIENLTDYEKLKCLYVIHRVSFFFLECGEDQVIVYNDGSMRIDNPENTLLKELYDNMHQDEVDGEAHTNFIESFWSIRNRVSDKSSKYHGKVSFGYDKHLHLVYNGEEEYYPPIDEDATNRDCQ